MLDVQTVHAPARAWRDFLIEIATIVVGLCIAVGIQQTVEAVHNHRQLSQTRQALRLERAENRETLASQTIAWRWTAVELQNNLQVFQYLKEHPGTPQENLPGILLWRYTGLVFTSAVWNATHQSGAIALLSREEIEENTLLYFFLNREFEATTEVVSAINEAERYTLSDSDPSRLNPAQIAAEIERTQTALTKHLTLGVLLQNFQSTFPDFPSTVSLKEVKQFQHPPDEQTFKLLAPARALTMERLKAAGYVDPNPPAMK